MNRRHLLQTLGAAPLAAAVPAEVSRITVSALEIFKVKVNKRGNWVLPRIRTSAGLSGIGDASHGSKDDAVIGCMQQFFERLKGRSIFDIEWLRREMSPEVARQGVVAAVALSGLEQCLWDIRGQAFGVPVCDLLGGALQTGIRNYANINRSTDPRTPAGFATMAGKAVEAGFDAVKLAPFDEMPRHGDAATLEEFTRRGIERAEAVRKAIGPDRDLLVDAHSRFDVKRGLDLARRFESLNLFWLEEVTPAKPLENLATINREAKMPTAGGESIFTVKGFYPYIAAGAVDIVMPDVKYCGGVLELKKIAALAEGAGLMVAPHGPASPVGNMAAAHICATLPNFHILEFSYGEVPWRAELVEPAETPVKGRLEVTRRPGFGIRLNEKTISRYRA